MYQLDVMFLRYEYRRVMGPCRLKLEIDAMSTTIGELLGEPERCLNDRVHQVAKKGHVS